MPRIKPAEKHELDSATATTLDAVGKKLGMVPNLFSTLAHAPVALTSYLGLSDNLSGGELTAQQREIVALAVAQCNQCQYCLSAHNLMAKGAGLSEEDIVKARKGDAYNTLNQTIAAFASEVTESRGVITDEAFNLYVGQGLSTALMIEIMANVALNLLTNYINHLADTDIDFPVVDVELATAV
jgi:uncharacterized peroxidase-related enzyme